MDYDEAIVIAMCVQTMPPNQHVPFCENLNTCRLGYVFEADGKGEVTVKMKRTAHRAKSKLLTSLMKREEAGK